MLLFNFTGCNNESNNLATNNDVKDTNDTFVEELLFPTHIKTPDKIIRFNKGNKEVFEKDTKEYTEQLERINLQFSEADFSKCATYSGMTNEIAEESKGTTEVLELLYSNINILPSTDREYSRLLFVMERNGERFEMFLGDDERYFSTGYIPPEPSE